MTDGLTSFIGEQARHLARFGSFSSRAHQRHPWWAETICSKIERIDWVVSELNEPGDCWQEFTAFDISGRILGVDGL